MALKKKKRKENEGYGNADDDFNVVVIYLVDGNDGRIIHDSKGLYIVWRRRTKP